MAGDFIGIKGLDYVGAGILQATTKIILNDEPIYLESPLAVGQVFMRVQLEDLSYAWINKDIPTPFQMLVAKDIETGTIQEYDLILLAREDSVINSIVVECDNGSLDGCTLLIGTAEVTFGSGTTLSITDTLTALTPTDTNLITAGDRVKLVTSATFTGTPTMITVQLNYSRQ